MKNTLLVLAAALTIVSLQSCKETPKTNDTTTTNTTEAMDATDPKAAFINKYNAYVGVWNTVSPRVENSYSFFTRIINPETGTPFKEQDVYHIPPVPETSVISTLEKFTAEKPSIDELDDLGPQLVKAYNDLQTPLEQLSDYYKNKSYLEDDFKKSKELYPVVNKAFEQFLTANEQLGGEIQKIDLRLSTEELQAYKEEGLELLYTRGMLLNSIKKHSAPLYSAVYDSYEEIDMDSYDKNLAEMIEHYTAFKALAKDKERVKKEMNISRPSPFIILYSNLDTYVRESRNLKDLIKDPKDYAQMKSTVSRMGINFANSSHVKVIKAAEAVINTSNSLN